MLSLPPAIHAVDSTPGETERPTESERSTASPEIIETKDTLQISFSRDPEARIFVDARDRHLLVAQPGKKTVAPRLDNVRGIVFDGGRRTVTLEWRTHDGGTEMASFENVDAATWDRLHAFMRRVPSPPEMRRQ